MTSGQNLALLALLQFWVASHPSTGPILTFREARGLSPAELSARFSEHTGRSFPEAQAYQAQLPWTGLARVELASAPRATAFPGLCEADRAGFGYNLGTEMPDGLDDPPRPVSSQMSGRVYKIVGDTSPARASRTAAYRRSLASLCERAGPVLSAPAPTLSAAQFFAGSFETFGDMEPVHAWVAAHALQQAISSAQSGRLSTIQCSEDPDRPADHICVDPRASLAALSTSSVIGLDVGSCEPSERGYCVVATFERESDPRRILTVRIRTGLSTLPQSQRDFAISAVSIAGESFDNRGLISSETPGSPPPAGPAGRT
jgi:hypothetical protein